MSEVPTVKMQLVSDGKAVLIDIEPPTDEELEAQEKRKEVIRSAPVLRELPDDTLVLYERTPDSGNPFLEINCGEIRTGAEYRGLKLDEANFAGEIADLLREHGDVVTFDPVIKPIEQSGYMFLGMSAIRPQD